MSLFAIADLHLSLGADKPMDVFGGWHDYVARLTENWNALVAGGDTVVIAGDVSWGMSLEQSLADFTFLNRLPGQKILLKGNHDYWWGTKSKMERFFSENGLSTFRILHNNSYSVEGRALAGTRGWMLEEGEAHDQLLTAREAGRLETSLREAKKHGENPTVFLHYPPLFGGAISGNMVDLMLKYDVKECFYGHLHGAACGFATQGSYLGINFTLISADHLKFKPILLENSNKN